MRFVVLTAAVALGALPAHADFASQFFKEGSHQAKLLFNQTGTNQKAGGDTKMRFITTSPDKKEAVIEETTLRDGQLQSYSLNQKQLGELGQLEVRGNKIHFSYTKSGKTETNDESRSDNLVVGPTIFAFVQQHWGEL